MGIDSRLPTSDTFPYRARLIPPGHNFSTKAILEPTHPENCRIAVVWKNIK